MKVQLTFTKEQCITVEIDVPNLNPTTLENASKSVSPNDIIDISDPIITITQVATIDDDNSIQFEMPLTCRK